MLNVKPSNADDTALLVKGVREAGETARKFFGGSYRQWDKSKGNPVTEADVEIDAHLRRVFLAERPDYGWLSEESEDDPSRLERSRVFVVDPIDGTHGFIRGRPHFTIVAAVVENGRPVSAAIYNPISEEMYVASKGMGAQLNSLPIRVSTQDNLAGARLLAPRDIGNDPQWRSAFPKTTQIENRASIAYRLALVAEGRHDAVISLSEKHDWDLAAGDLILHEAGGRVTSQGGALLRYNCVKPLQRGVVCAGPALHQMILDLLQP